ncbi:MAG TPA: DNA-formamidopyrimidine glycosylase family protein [Flavobacteriales bacterium]
MPEGPSILLVKEDLQPFVGKVVFWAYGNSKIDQQRLLNKELLDIKSWGKHLLLCFKDFTVRIHFLMFGSYTINERKEGRLVRLGLQFHKGEMNFYACAIKVLEGDIDMHYDWSADVMNDVWDKKKARTKLKARPDELICDVLLNQDIFSGVGNIIKNEVLYRMNVHPESLVGKIPVAKLNKVIDDARSYSFLFLEWKRKYELKRNWQVHTKKFCEQCGSKLIKSYPGHTKRRSYYCENCQILYQ